MNIQILLVYEILIMMVWLQLGELRRILTLYWKHGMAFLDILKMNLCLFLEIRDMHLNTMVPYTLSPCVY